jgi:sterol desaturase/sphingolipid hydroxylase (fatty acid hydroxylase superfamily)
MDARTAATFPRSATPVSAVSWAVTAAFSALVAVMLLAGVVFGLAVVLLPRPGDGATAVHRLLYQLISSPDKINSVATLGFGVLGACLYLGTRGGRSLKRTRIWRMLRIVFAPGYFRHRSHAMDVLFVIANTKVFGFALGWFIVSGLAVTHLAYGGLIAGFGPQPMTTLSPLTVTLIGSVMLYLAYELGYYIDHYTSHKFEFFWQFHRVHHEAEVLSPLTTWRMHPVDSVKFANILALTGGTTNGLLHHLLGLEIGGGATFSASFLLLIFSFLMIQLQHTQLWIPFTGLLGRLFISPAHHQIHHSTNPAHFNRNLGSALAVFDWLFGTLHIPSKQREKLTFGVVPEADEPPHAPHSAVGALVSPFVRAYRGLVHRG